MAHSRGLREIGLAMYDFFEVGKTRGACHACMPRVAENGATVSLSFELTSWADPLPPPSPTLQQFHAIKTESTQLVLVLQKLTPTTAVITVSK